MPKYYAYNDPQKGYTCLEVADGEELPAEYAGATPLDLHFKPGVWDFTPRITAKEAERDFLRQFYADVCAEAETIMAQTNTVSGAHWNAMRRVLKRRGVEVE